MRNPKYTKRILHRALVTPTIKMWHVYLPNIYVVKNYKNFIFLPLYFVLGIAL